MFLPTVASFFCCVSLFFCNAQAADLPSKKIVSIGISQITSHPSLDKVRDGILEALRDAGYVEGSTAKIFLENANGRMPIAVQIAQKLFSRNLDIAVGISTPSAQTLVSAFSQRQTPLVFATVTDPIGAKLVPNLSKPEGRITGTQNLFPLDEHVKVIKNLFPQVKRVGVIVNLSEDNSAQMVKSIQSALNDLGITLEVAAVAAATEAKGAAEALVSKIDLLILLQDNTVATTLPAVTAVMNEHKIPTIAAFVEAISQGALMALAVDEKVIGMETGKIIVQILHGTPPGDIPVVTPHAIEIAFNATLGATFLLEKDFTQKAKRLFPTLVIKK